MEKIIIIQLKASKLITIKLKIKSVYPCTVRVPNLLGKFEFRDKG